jgi:pre-mRNA-processing factor 17
MTSLLGAGYESSSEDENVENGPKLTNPDALVVAPDVSLEVWSLLCHRDLGHNANILQDRTQMQMMLARNDDNALTYNVTYDNLARPTQGPANPFKATNGNVLKRKNVLTGNADETAMSEATFRAEHRTFQSLGYTKDPTVDGAYVGNQITAAKYGGRDVVQLKPTKEESAAIRAKRQKKGDSSIVEGEGAYLGPWAKYKDDDIAYEEEAAAADQELASDEEWVEEGIVDTDLPAPPKEATAYQDDVSTSETTEFHGESLYDYQGRTYMHVPQDLDLDLRKEPGKTITQRSSSILTNPTPNLSPLSDSSLIPHIFSSPAPPTPR